MPDEIDRMIHSLEVMEPLRQPVLREAIRHLNLKAGSQGLDIGCGIGLQARLLAEATGPDGRVTGMDISERLLAAAQEKVSSTPFFKRITFKQGDMNALPFEEANFDWVWSADCAGYPAGDLLPVLKEIARVLRPGGTAALLGWTSQALLPGYTMLEKRLNATCSTYAGLLQGQSPQAHFERALGWFSQAGFTQLTCQTIIGQVQSPLSLEMRLALVELFAMLWSQPSTAASKEDIAMYCRLCSPKSPDFILNLPDYNGFFTYTMFTGIR